MIFYTLYYMLEHNVHKYIFVIKKKKPLRTHFSILSTCGGLAMLQNYRAIFYTFFY